MAKFLKEAARVKQVLSANTEIFAQVSIILWNYTQILQTDLPKLISQSIFSLEWSVC